MYSVVTVGSSPRGQYDMKDLHRMNVSELMRPTTSYVDVSDTVSGAARLMRDTGSAPLVVMRDGAVQGVITERDMVLGCMADGHLSWECSVQRHLIPQRQTITPDTHVGDASLMIIDGEIDFLPVVGDTGLVGILSSEAIFGAIDRETAYSIV